ncbi:MAG: hypothetical protein WAJ93_04740, partial [Candidatus Nitrosopolaris sp.]
YGSIVEVGMRKAGSHKVSDTDARSLVEFRKQIYDIDIAVHDELWYFPNHIRSLRESQMPDANSL